MLEIKSKHRNYGINFPTVREEITKEVLTELVKSINLPKHYAVIALCSKVRLFDFISSIGSKKDYNVSMDICLAKINEEDNQYLKGEVNETAIIDRSAIERGNHLSVRTMISYVNAANYIKSDSDLYKSILSGDYNENGISPNIYLVEFKIVPVTEIKAIIKDSVAIVDPYLAQTETAC